MAGAVEGVAAPPVEKRWTIVPLAGIPVVVAVVLGLVVSIAGNWTWALDFFHVVGGDPWTGAGVIEYAFVYDDTRGAVLVVMTCLLATFTLNVPLIAALTVARFER